MKNIFIILIVCVDAFIGAGQIGNLLQRLGIPQPLIDEEMNAMQEIRLLKTASRSILGNMNDVGHLLNAHIYYGRIANADEIDWERQLSKRLLYNE